MFQASPLLCPLLDSVIYIDQPRPEAAKLVSPSEPIAEPDRGDSAKVLK